MSGPPVNLETAVVGDQGDVVPDPKENVASQIQSK